MLPYCTASASKSPFRNLSSGLRTCGKNRENKEKKKENKKSRERERYKAERNWKKTQKREKRLWNEEKKREKTAEIAIPTISKISVITDLSLSFSSLRFSLHLSLSVFLSANFGTSHSSFFSFFFSLLLSLSLLSLLISLSLSFSFTNFLRSWTVSFLHSLYSFLLSPHFCLFLPTFLQLPITPEYASLDWLSQRTRSLLSTVENIFPSPFSAAQATQEPSGIFPRNFAQQQSKADPFARRSRLTNRVPSQIGEDIERRRVVDMRLHSGLESKGAWRENKSQWKNVRGMQRNRGEARKHTRWKAARLVYVLRSCFSLLAFSSLVFSQHRLIIRLLRNQFHQVHTNKIFMLLLLRILVIFSLSSAFSSFPTLSLTFTPFLFFSTINFIISTRPYIAAACIARDLCTEWRGYESTIGASESWRRKSEKLLDWIERRRFLHSCEIGGEGSCVSSRSWSSNTRENWEPKIGEGEKRRWEREKLRNRQRLKLEKQTELKEKGEMRDNENEWQLRN